MRGREHAAVIHAALSELPTPLQQLRATPPRRWIQGTGRRQLRHAAWHELRGRELEFVCYLCVFERGAQPEWDRAPLACCCCVAGILTMIQPVSEPLLKRARPAPTLRDLPARAHGAMQCPGVHRHSRDVAGCRRHRALPGGPARYHGARGSHAPGRLGPAALGDRRSTTPRSTLLDAASYLQRPDHRVPVAAGMRGNRAPPAACRRILRIWPLGTAGVRFDLPPLTWCWNNVAPA